MPKKIKPAGKNGQFWAVYMQVLGTDEVRARAWEPVYRRQLLMVSRPSKDEAENFEFGYWSRSQSSNTNRSQWRWSGWRAGSLASRAQHRVLLVNHLTRDTGRTSEWKMPSFPNRQKPEFMLMSLKLDSKQLAELTSESGRTPYKILTRFKRSAMKRHGVDIS